MPKTGICRYRPIMGCSLFLLFRYTFRESNSWLLGETPTNRECIRKITYNYRKNIVKWCKRGSPHTESERRTSLCLNRLHAAVEESPPAYSRSWSARRVMKKIFTSDELKKKTCSAQIWYQRRSWYSMYGKKMLALNHMRYLNRWDRAHLPRQPAAPTQSWPWAKATVRNYNSDSKYCFRGKNTVCSRPDAWTIFVFPLKQHEKGKKE